MINSSWKIFDLSVAPEKGKKSMSIAEGTAFVASPLRRFDYYFEVKNVTEIIVIRAIPNNM